MPFLMVRDDLATLSADALVVTANEALRIQGSVGAAVAKVAGARELQAACDAIGGCAVGNAVMTSAYGAPARHIIHAVGPLWRGGGFGEAALLARTIGRVLQLAWEAGDRSLALPLISAGTNGYPTQEALSLHTEVITSFLAQHEMQITLVLFDRASVIAGTELAFDIQSYIDDVYVQEHTGPRSLSLFVGSEASFDGELFDRGAQASLEPPPSASPEPLAPTASVAKQKKYAGKIFSKQKKRSKRSRRSKKHPAQSATTPHQAGAPQSPNAPSSGLGPSVEAQALTAQSDTSATSAQPVASAQRSPARARLKTQGRAKHKEISLDEASLLLPELENRVAHLDLTFSQTLLRLIDLAGKTDVEIYKRANISRQLFSKIRSDAHYRPSKKTAVAFAVALELSLDETSDLLARAGFALSHSRLFDVIVEYFIENGQYDTFTINEVLYAYDQELLGS